MNGTTDFPTAPVAIGDDWVVYKRVERTTPNKADFSDEAKAEKMKALLALKKKEAISGVVQSLRKKAQASGELKIKLATSEPAGNDKS